MKAGTTKYVAVDGQQTHEKADPKGNSGPDSDVGARCSPLPPIGDRQHAEAWQSQRVPIRQSCLVKRKQRVKRKNRQAKPEQVKRFELLVHSPAFRNDCPGQTEQKKR